MWVVIHATTGPVGGPGMREMLSHPRRDHGQGLGDSVALITDGRFQCGTYGLVVGHVARGRRQAGAIALIQTGDTITVDTQACACSSFNVTPAELEAPPRHLCAPPEPATAPACWAKYARQR